MHVMFLYGAVDRQQIECMETVFAAGLFLLMNEALLVDKLRMGYGLFLRT